MVPVLLRVNQHYTVAAMTSVRLKSFRQMEQPRDIYIKHSLTARQEC
jgi:hypothetical protein